ncbi:MAG: hypothetical protein RIC56_17190 [Pseudomonadales bacterium]
MRNARATRNLTLLVLLTCLGTGCSPSSETEPLATEHIEASFGGFLVHDGDPGIVVSIPPGALSANADLTLSQAESGDFAGATSSLILLEPVDLKLQVPGSLSFAIDSPQPTWVVAWISESGLVALPTRVDPTVNEVRAEIGELGRYVIVDTARAELAPAPDLPNRVSTGLAAATAADIDGDWRGVEPHDGFAIRFSGDTFELSRDGESIRAGRIERAGERISLIDEDGSVETGRLYLEGDELVLSTDQSGEVRWTQAQEEEPAGGFFALDTGEADADAETGSQAPAEGAARSAGQASGNRPQAVSATPPPAQDTGPAAGGSEAAASAGDDPEKRGFFRRLGGGIKKIGGNVVGSVKNLGRSTADKAQQTAEDSVAQAEQTAEQVVNDAGNQVAGTIDQTSRQVTGAMEGAADDALARVTPDGIGSSRPVSLGGGGGRTPQLPATGICLLTAAEISGSIGMTVDAPRPIKQPDPASERQEATCQYRNPLGHGDFEIRHYLRTMGSVPREWEHSFKLRGVQRIGGIGDDAYWHLVESGPFLEVGVLLGNSQLTLIWQGNHRWGTVPTPANVAAMTDLLKTSMGRLQ